VRGVLALGRYLLVCACITAWSRPSDSPDAVDERVPFLAAPAAPLEVGGAVFHQDLSARRAEAVRSALVTRHGIASERLTRSGAGDSRPRESNSTPEGRACNRRVELARQ
jgi:hypothetical protein